MNIYLFCKINLHSQKKPQLCNFFAKATGFLDICCWGTPICLLTCLLVDCLSPPDQADLFIYSVQTHFFINFGGKKKKAISSCAEPTKTLTVPQQRRRFMNIWSRKAGNLNSSKGYFYPTCWSLLVAPALSCLHISPGFHVSSLSRASLLHCPPNYLIQFYLFCINVQVWSATQEKMYSGLRTRSLDQHSPAGEMDFSADVFFFAFARLRGVGSTSPTFSLLPGLSVPWQLLSEMAKKEPALQTVAYLAHCDFLKKNINILIWV